MRRAIGLYIRNRICGPSCDYNPTSITVIREILSQIIPSFNGPYVIQDNQVTLTLQPSVQLLSQILIIHGINFIFMLNNINLEC